jgi:NADH:ubiquinone oxidoreductase subunit E
MPNPEMENRPEVIICLGSSCFARGNRKTVKLISDYLKNHNLLGMVNFHGGHCFGRCDKGPVLKIDQEFNEKLSSESVNVLLDKFFKDAFDSLRLNNS